jgi:hypothetical protein
MLLSLTKLKLTKRMRLKDLNTPDYNEFNVLHPNNSIMIMNLCLKTLKINKYINKNILEAFDNVSRLEQG